MKPNPKVSVSALALSQVLIALDGPPHYIRELQATRSLPMGDKNPIDILIEEFNSQVEEVNAAFASASRS